MRSPNTALEESGVPDDALRLVVVRDRQTAAFHAVTVVYVGNEPLVLDNLVMDVLPARSITRYAPYYSINRSGWWYYEADVPRFAGSGAVLSMIC